MIDSERNLIICNEPYASIYGLPPELVQPGTPVKTILEYRIEQGLHTDAEAYLRRRFEIMEKRERVVETVELQDGRVISAVHNPMSDGGWVSTHQDITDQVHQIRALEQRESELERQNMRFEAAVNNMWQGLCMFDADKRLVICNEDYARMYKLPPELVRPGTSINEIFAARLAAGVHPAGGSPDTYFNRRLAVVENPHDNIDEVELQDGRVIAVRHHPMPDGGWVATHIDVTEQRRNEARIRHLARHDTLTDLPNRMLFLEHMELAQLRIRRRENMAVLCFDLDRFKAVNDTFGHSTGDAVLATVGARLRECCRQADVVARLGGDEFAALVGPLPRPEDAADVARKIIKLMGQPFEVQGHVIQIGASVGIAVAPNDGEDADTLMKNADLALYRAKSEGRGAYHFFERGMDAALQARRAIETELRGALTKGELQLVFQPQFSLSENRICGLEALLRWSNPRLGHVPPLEFIPIAEETGLIVPIGEWVLREACVAAGAWPGDVSVAVNLSPVQFKSRNLVQHVVSALAAAELGAQRLELEITESVLLADNEATLKILHQLRSLGVRISMDDFGTGYSSLSYLRSFPFDKIKIDQSFVRDLLSREGSLAIVKAVIGLGHSLGMSTTAEGVETAEQLRVMRDEGCTEVQGFLFSPPLSASAAARLFADKQPALVDTSRPPAREQRRAS
jgi:diguanylate cyclase (GGDEF)-like protein